ncbi:MAG: hypothetical protein NUW37_17105 [Planctomycetes bacterium]|nr:hypothetical protein [Planctomycetota bacterium]
MQKTITVILSSALILALASCDSGSSRLSDEELPQGVTYPNNPGENENRSDDPQIEFTVQDNVEELAPAESATSTPGESNEDSNDENPGPFDGMPSPAIGPDDADVRTPPGQENPHANEMVHPWEDAVNQEWCEYLTEGDVLKLIQVNDTRGERVFFAVINKVAGSGSRPGYISPPVPSSRSITADAYESLARAEFEDALEIDVIKLPGMGDRELRCLKRTTGETVIWYSPEVPCEGIVRVVTRGVLRRELVRFGVGIPPWTGAR